MVDPGEPSAPPGRPRVLVAPSRDAPVEIVRPVTGALGAEELDVQTVDLGRIDRTGSRLGRVVQAIMGELEAGRLMRALAELRPDAAVAFDPGALAALVLARDKRVSPTPAVAVVPDLAPGPAWAIHADRWAVVDDEAAVALADHGADGARIVVTGPIVAHAVIAAAREDRAAVRAEYKIPSDAPVVLVDAASLSTDALAQVALQLALFERRIFVLFDAGTHAAGAAFLRRQVPTLGIRGKLFGETPNAARFWRSADVIVARPGARATHQALALGCALVVLEPQGDREQAEARALSERGLGGAASPTLVLAAALEPLVAGGRRGTPSGGRAAVDGAAAIAALVADVAAQRDEVLAETFASAPPEAGRAAARAAPDEPAGDLEDLDDLGGLGGLGVDDAGAAARPPGPDRATIDRLHAEVSATEARARRDLDAARDDAERWEQRRTLAEARGDAGLAEQAAREADRKRARMHAALEELARLASEKARLAQAGSAGRASGSPPRRPIDDELDAIKRKVSASGRSLDDELADLKRRAEAERRGRKR